MRGIHKAFAYLIIFCTAVCSMIFADVYALQLEPATASDFKVDPFFGDNMVFQQNEEIRVWGTSASEGKYINARLGESYAAAKVSDGSWELSFAPRVYSSEPLVLEIYGGEGSEYVSFENIRIGDVWWVTGQSNIEFAASASSSWTDFAASLTGEENVYIYEIGDSFSDGGSHDRWRRLNRYSSASASALACFVSKGLTDAFKNEIPIGMIVTGYSGAELASFMPPQLTEDAAFAAEKNKIYNNVISHFVKAPVRGIIWYQGEADASVYSDYSQKLSSFITWLRKQKNQYRQCFPVYAVELTPCFWDGADPNRQYIDYGEVRGETGVLCAGLDNFYMCPTSDLWKNKGYSNNLHPDNKQQIAQRLCSMILSGDYGYEGYELFFGPQLTGYTISDNGKCAVLTFDMELADTSTAGFTVIDGQWQPITDTDIIIDAARITVKSKKEIKIIRYNTTTDNVFGEDIFLKSLNGMPVSAFSVTYEAPENKEQESHALWHCGNDALWLRIGVLLFSLLLIAVVYKYMRF